MIGSAELEPVLELRTCAAANSRLRSESVHCGTLSPGFVKRTRSRNCGFARSDIFQHL